MDVSHSLPPKEVSWFPGFVLVLRLQLLQLLGYLPNNDPVRRSSDQHDDGCRFGTGNVVWNGHVQVPG